MDNDLKSLIEIEETKLNILLEDLSSKTQEYLSKRFEIDQKYIELSQIRKNVYSLQFQITNMESESAVALEACEHTDKSDQKLVDNFLGYLHSCCAAGGEYEFDKGKVRLKEYKSEFSSYLKKEFNKLDIKTKRELFKEDLLKVKFSLNYLKYAKIKEEGKETKLDDYVFERKGTFPYYLNIKYNDETLKELKNIKEQEKKDSKSEDTFRDIEIKDLEEEIKEKLYDKEEWFYNDDDEEENY
jgi:hypothetical protein